MANYNDHNAEWNFLRGAVCYRRGWLDEAKRYYQTACQMEPGNSEYQQLLSRLQSGGQTYQSASRSYSVRPWNSWRMVRSRPITPGEIFSARKCAAPIRV